jgi:transposase
MPETHIMIPLDLPEVCVLEVEVTGAGYRITVESTVKGTRCRRCGREIEAVHGYNDWVEVQHLPIFDRAVFIRYRPKRYRCPYCEGGPTTTQEVSWHRPQSGFTKAFEEHLLKALINSTVRDVSLKEGLSYDAVLGVLERRIAGQVDWARFERLGVLGIDEIALKKGQRDYAVIVSARLEDESLAVLGVLGDRSQATVQAFLERIPARLKASIHTVCVDMYETYHQAVKAALPHADLVVDRFHVAKHYGAAADRVRKDALKQLKKTLPAAEYQTLKGSHRVFRKHRAALNPQEKALLERLFTYAPKLRLVYAFREYLFTIFETARSLQDAQTELSAWLFLVREQRIPGFEPFLKTLQHYWVAITNFFKRSLTSGFVEGLNNRIRVLTRRCFGLFNLTHFFQRLWLDLEGYRAFGYTH